jgi:predicted dienelactone hydrolase
LTLGGVALSALEIVVLVGAVALSLCTWVPGRRRREVAIAIAALTAYFCLELIAHGLRWQMVPVLLAAVLALGLVRLRPRVRAAWSTAMGTVVCLGLIALTPIAARAFPIPVFPTPSGPYAVGTTVMQWTDLLRPEPATADPDDHREIVAQLWYPAQDIAADAERARYLGRTQEESETVARALAENAGLPPFTFDAIPRTRTHAVPDATPAGQRFPVVLFSPGSGEVRGQCTAWAEDLASRGYVVAGLDHPYDSPVVVLTDGRTIRGATDQSMLDQLVRTRAADLGFTLTQLGRLDRGEIAGPLTGHLDVSEAAVTGHSLGGAAALALIGEDRRFAAAVDLDGNPTDPSTQPYPQPVLAITSPRYYNPTDDYAVRLDRALDRSTTAGYRLTIPGSGHLSPTDLPLFLPPMLPSMFGSLDRDSGPRITADATAAFLGQTLRLTPTDPAAVLRRYGDVVVHPG